MCAEYDILVVVLVEIAGVGFRQTSRAATICSRVTRTDTQRQHLFVLPAWSRPAAQLDRDNDPGAISVFLGGRRLSVRLKRLTQLGRIWISGLRVLARAHILV